MKAYILPLLILFTISGCAEYDALSTGVAVTGAQAADRALSAAEWEMCRAGSVGAVVRRYGQSQEMWSGWNQICFGHRELEKPGNE